VELALKLAALFGVPVDSLFSLTPFPSLATQIASAQHQRLESNRDELTLTASR
jgi:DNA-binding XRE family transcriptional regulator